MHILRQDEVQFLTDIEIRWCKDHPEVPEAQKALHHYARFLRARADREMERRSCEATEALRKIRPREPNRVDEVFAYVMYRPDANPPTEGIPAMASSVDLRPGVRVTTLSFLMGLDRQHVASLQGEVAKVRQDLGVVKGLRLQRMTFDRAIPFEKVPYLRERNLETRTVSEFFAYVGTPPGSQDETILGCSMKGLRAREAFGDRIGGGSADQFMVMLAHPDASRIVTMLPEAKAFRAAGQRVELRRFVRAEEIDQEAFLSEETLLEGVA